VSADGRTEATAATGLGRSAGIMAAGTAVSRVLGMVRAAMLVWAIGVAGLAANAFDLANKLPNILVMLIAGGVINAVLVPQVVRAYQKGGGDNYVNRILTLGGTLLLALTILLTAGSGVLIWMYSRGGAESIALATGFAFWCIPQVFFYGMYTLLGQVLNARGSFGPYMWAPVVNNVVAIAGLGLFIGLFGQFNDGGPTSDPAWWTGGRIALLAGIATLGVAAQAAVIVWPLHKLGFRFRPTWGLRGVGLRSTMRVAGWTFAALLVGQLAFLLANRVMTAADPSGTGVAPGNAAFSSAYMIYVLPHSLVTVSLLTALFTRLSSHAALKDSAAVRSDFSSGARTVGVFTVLATAVLAVLALPLTRVILPSLHGSAVSAVSDVVVALVAGLAALGLWSLYQQLSYAYEEARALFWIQCGMALVVAGGSWLAMATLPARFWTIGVGVATSLSYVLGTVLAGLILHRRLGGLDEARVTRMYVRAGAAAGLAALIGWAMVHVAARIAPLTSAGIAGFSRAAVVCIVVGLVMTAVYVGLLRLMRVRELTDLVAPLVQRARRLARR
jgi:putative peptidoglycan lipid II flippase